MKKENIIDMISYVDQKEVKEIGSSISDELKHAIQSLIFQLREKGPIQSIN